MLRHFARLHDLVEILLSIFFFVGGAVPISVCLWAAQGVGKSPTFTTSLVKESLAPPPPHPHPLFHAPSCTPVVNIVEARGTQVFLHGTRAKKWVINLEI